MYEIITLPNGVRIAHEKMSGVRSAAVGIWVGVGSRYEKRGEEGSAHFIEHMLFKGTAHSTAAELAGRMDAIGGHLLLRPRAGQPSGRGVRYSLRNVLRFSLLGIGRRQ